MYICVVLNRVFREDDTDKGHLRKGQEEDRVGCLGEKRKPMHMVSVGLSWCV